MRLTKEEKSILFWMLEDRIDELEYVDDHKDHLKKLKKIAEKLRKDLYDK